MKIYITLFIIQLSLSTFAQDHTALTEYLQTHAINFDPSSNNDSFILAKMKGKTLLLYGEGGSHDLKANYVIEAKLANTLSSTGLFRNYFMEDGRITAFVWNTYAYNGYDFNFINTDKFYSQKYLKQIRDNKYQTPPRFIGIDFETWYLFFSATNYILAPNKPLKNLFLLKITDSVSYNYYYSLNEKSYFTSWKTFNKFYKGLAKEFERDSLAIKAEIANDSVYQILHYLVTNPNNTIDRSDRNPPMVKNLLAETVVSDTNYVDFLPIGSSHLHFFISPKFLNAPNSKLKDKVLAINMVCKDCNVEGVALGNKWKKIFFKSEATYQCFEQVASKIGQYVLFDLTALPPEFQYLRKLNGDLLLFATNVD